ncbi:MAG: hypothetical protein HRU21_07165, partial [Pseudomonadales bacterium]|nr:hypothetical protein [Pseudomonadales bacterium]
GHVAWRNNRQTFDAARFMVTPIDKFKIDYTYINSRYTPLGGEVKTEDHFVNLSYQTPVGKVSGYTYIIDPDNGLDDALSTYGIRFAGSTGDDITFKYAAEYASQTKEQEVGDDFDADYLLAEFGLGFSGINLTLGYEQLGSDDAQFGFSTPYATGHKFAGFADQFLATPNEGLQDTYFTVSGKLAGIKLAATYHDFSADESTDTVDDLGSEIDFVAVKPIGKNYLVGFKYAAYSAGDDAAGKVDTDKLWLWTELKF